jgi:hypothetical protein
MVVVMGAKFFARSIERTKAADKSRFPAGNDRKKSKSKGKSGSECVVSHPFRKKREMDGAPQFRGWTQEREEPLTR